MASITRCMLTIALGAALALGCGDDDKNDTPEPMNTPDASMSMSDGGRLTEPGNTAATELGPQVAGKACANDAECAGRGAKCLPRLTLGSGGQVLEQLAGVTVFLDNPGGYCSAACMNNAACGAGGICFGALPGIGSGECRKTCSADGDCREGYECAKQGSFGDAGVPTLIPSTCQPRVKPASLTAGAVGKACTEQNAASTCGGGTCSPITDICTGVCLTDADCGSGGRCRLVQFYGTVGYCEESCTTDADCNAFTDDSGTIGCTAENVCGLKQFPLRAGVVGKECTDRAQCGGSAECATMLGAGAQAKPAPGGYCSLASCTSNSQCGGGTCVGTGVATRCYKSCTADTDCRMGYTCQDRMGVDRMPAKICAPAP